MNRRYCTRCVYWLVNVLVSVFNRRRGTRDRGVLSEIERERVLFRWHERLNARWHASWYWLGSWLRAVPNRTQHQRDQISRDQVDEVMLVRQPC